MVMSGIKEKVDGFFNDVKFSSPVASSSKTTKQGDDGDKMKVRLMEKWNNFKYEMSEGTELKIKSPLWLLGKCYFLVEDSETSSPEAVSEKKEGKRQFVNDFASKPWFTYRKGFPPFPHTSLTSDTGWGCMIRTSQMMLCQGLIMHFLEPCHVEAITKTADLPVCHQYTCIHTLFHIGRYNTLPILDQIVKHVEGIAFCVMFGRCCASSKDVNSQSGREWRWLLMRPEDLKQKRLHRMIIQWFIDEKNAKCPFSIHQLTEIGLLYKYKPGDWYGPSSMAYIMQDAVECGKGANAHLNNIVIYVAQDCAVYTKDVIDTCNWNITVNPNRSVIVLIPIRLGESTMNPVYIPCLRGLFQLRHFLGIVGGKPKHSLYFVGIQDDFLIYLDPHYSQVADQVQTFSNKRLDSYYCSSPRKMHISKLDPSCCLGFYCKDEDDFKAFMSEVDQFLIPPEVKTNCPLFLFADGSVRDHNKYVSKIVKDPPPKYENSNDSVINNIPETASSSSKDLQNDSVKPSDSTAGFSLSNTKQFISKLYRQKSRSPKSERKNMSLEEDFELL